MLGHLSSSHEQGGIAEGEEDEEVSDYLLWAGRSQLPRGLRRGSAAVRLTGLLFRIPPEAVFCECCVLSWLRSLRLTDNSSRGVLPSVMCLSVMVKPR